MDTSSQANLGNATQPAAAHALLRDDTPPEHGQGDKGLVLGPKFVVHGCT
jgi:hypothetical protein